VTAWDTTTGRSDVVIAELDTGVRYDHPDLLAATANGRLLAGYDSSRTVRSPMMAMVETLMHPIRATGSLRRMRLLRKFSGLHRREQLLARNTGGRDSGRAVQQCDGHHGITWLPRILPVRVLGKCGGVDSDILDAMRWAAGCTSRAFPTILIRPRSST